MSEKDQQEDEVAIPKPSRARRVIRWLVIVMCVWLLGDFGYSRYVASKIEDWESKVRWTETGYTPDASEVIYRKAESTKSALLMVHGFSDTPQMYRKLGPKLASRGYDCHTILLPGFGRDVEAYANGKSEKWVQKVEEKLRELKNEYEHVVLVAHSLGGAVSINVTLDGETRPDALVLLAPAIEVSNSRSPILPTRFWHEFSKYALPSTKITYSPFKMDAKDPAEQERELRNRFSPRSVVDETFKLIDANRGRAGEIQCPTLVFNAVNDKVVDPNAIESFYEQCGSEAKGITRLSESGHMVPVDVEWMDVVEQTDKFLIGAFKID